MNLDAFVEVFSCFWGFDGLRMHALFAALLSAFGSWLCCAGCLGDHLSRSEHRCASPGNTAMCVFFTSKQRFGFGFGEHIPDELFLFFVAWRRLCLVYHIRKTYYYYTCGVLRSNCSKKPQVHASTDATGG